MNKSDLATLTKIITKVAQQELLPRFNNCDVSTKKDQSFVTEADIAIQHRLQLILKENWPSYDFFAEEMTEAEMSNFFAQSSAGFWCLDPLDGTSNFVAGVPYFSISLALIIDNVTVLGIVCDPNKNECFSALKGEGAWLNGVKIEMVNKKTPLKQAIALVDLKRLSPKLKQRLVLDQPYHSQRSFGSVALDWCWLASGRVQIYLHGKMMLWDYAAGLLIAHESGCLTSGLDGLPVYQLNLEPRQAMGAVEQEIYAEWKEYLALR